MTSWYTPPPLGPIQYVPASLKDDIRAKEVIIVRAVGHEQIHGPDQGGFTNHWCLYLETAPSESVCLDMSPSGASATVVPGGTKGIIAISLLDRNVPENAERVGEVSTVRAITIGQIVDLLVQQGRERYEFTSDGVGCRKWVTDTLNMLADMQWLDKAGVTSATTDIRKLWPNGTPLELDCGQYY